MLECHPTSFQPCTHPLPEFCDLWAQPLIHHDVAQCYHFPVTSGTTYSSDGFLHSAEMTATRRSVRVCPGHKKLYGQ